MSTDKIAVIAGDGIGKKWSRPALPASSGSRKFIHWTCSSRISTGARRYYLQHGRMMPTDGLEQLAQHHAIFLGAVGSPEVSDTESLWGLLIPIRREFQQYTYLRPVKTLDGVLTPGRQAPHRSAHRSRKQRREYSEVGGRMYRGLPQGARCKETIFTRLGRLR